MSSPELRFSKTSECKETTYVIIALVVLVLILLWVSSGSSEEQTYEVETNYSTHSSDESKSCGCGCEDLREGMDSVPENKPQIQYAARVLSAEGLVGQPSFQQAVPPQPSFQQAVPPQPIQQATYTVQSPALRAMFESPSVQAPSQDMYETSSQSHSSIADSFGKMRSSTVPKSMTYSKKEGFSNEFSSVAEPESTTGRIDSPFFGPISL